MSTEIPRLPRDDGEGDDNAVFDDLARRAGAALRRPAPADGVQVIAARQRRQQALKASVVGGVAMVTVIGALVIIANRDDPDTLPPVGSSFPTTPATTAAPAPTALLPVDSAPATLPAASSPTPTATASVPADSVPATIPTPPTVSPSLWVELEPGATAPLPPAPLPPAFEAADLVWTGSEFIVWGGIADDPAEPRSQALGAAFDPVAGTWRQIAAPPDGVREPLSTGTEVVLWTGTEMLVWSNGTPDTASAAYDPATDTWRSIADPPAPTPTRGTVALWIGDEAVLLRDPDVDQDGFTDPVSSPSFAYDPATDEWRRLADGPWGIGLGYVSGGSTSAVWTGTTLITLTDADPDDGMLLNGYDPATDTWRTLEPLDTDMQPVVIPGRDGAPATVAFLSSEPDAPVELINDRGEAIGELAGRPADVASTCYEPSSNENNCILTSLRAAAVGGELLFWHSEDGWGIDPETQTWRSLPLDGRQPGWDGTEVVAAGDLLFAWSDDRDGLVYRAATPG